MTSTFVDLSSSRKGKESKSYVRSKAYPSSTSPHPVSSQPDNQDEHPSELFSYLPKALEIRETEYVGRGLWAKEPFHPGTTILACKPLLAVLSNQYLNSHCSACAGSSPSTKLQRCTKCKVVLYCDSSCQQRDWGFHKSECNALQRWAAAAPSRDVSIPSDAIRCLGRLLWKRQKAGPIKDWTREIDSMLSHRSSMPPSATESHTHLAHSLVRYIGVTAPDELAAYGITSAGDLVDVISRFTTNAFNLASPSLEPIGVCISPPVALINHSCLPNAVIVFPRTAGSTDKEPQMQIIAIRPITAGEEVLTAYIDTRVPKPMRQQSLSETYNFMCKCELCSGDHTTVDPRAAMCCPNTCGGVCPLPENDIDIVRCDKCKAVVKSTDAILDVIRVSQEGLDKATALQFKDPEKSKQLVNNLIPILLSAGLTPSAHPLLAMSHLQQSLLIATLTETLEASLAGSECDRTNAQELLDDAIRTANRHVTGLITLLHEGHPIRALAFVELGKLLMVDEPAPKETPNSNGQHPRLYGVKPPYPPSGPARLKLAYSTLVQAHKELLIGFGKANEGGEVGKDVRERLIATEKELGVWKQGIQNVIEDQPKPIKQ